MKTLFVYSDGGALNNPGPAGLGVVITDERGQVLKKISQYIGRATNNQAEYKALILALKTVVELKKQAEWKEAAVRVFLDSELLVRQLNLQYKVKDKALQLLFLEVYNLAVSLKKVSFTHIPREQNRLADQLVKQALRKTPSQRP